MNEFKAGDEVLYKNPIIGNKYDAVVLNMVEGWPELIFRDGSTCIVRPSRVEHRDQKSNEN
jgi:hypothetical protein